MTLSQVRHAGVCVRVKQCERQRERSNCSLGHCFKNTHIINKMDKDLDSGRRKKSDKAKEKQARNGSFSQKHVQIQEEQAARANQRNACVKAEGSSELPDGESCLIMDGVEIRD